MERYLGLALHTSSSLGKHQREDGSTAVHDDGKEPQPKGSPFEPFQDLYKRRFLWYYESYQASVKMGLAKAKDGTSFKSMPFESLGNGLNGTFNFTRLGERLVKIKSTLDQELETWVAEGLLIKQKESAIARNLQRQFDSLALWKGDSSRSANAVSLDGENPLVWVITYFGRPMTNLDGAMLRIKLHLSPLFPEVQPRAFCKNKIFHHHVAPDGTIAYTAPFEKREELRTHIEAIVASLEDESPAYDPRKIVNLEASKLYWGKEADSKKKYNRLLRRSVEENAC